MTKILIGGGELAALLAKHPEIEMELTKQASSQVADQVLKKIDRKAIRDGIITDLNKELSSKWRFPTQANDIIRLKVAEAVADAIDAEARRMIVGTLNQKVEEIVKGYKKTIEGNLERAIDRIILEKVTSTLKAAANLRG